MELWGRMQNVMDASGVHQAVAQLEQTMKDASADFVGEIYTYVNEATAQLEKNLAAYWEETRGLQEQIPVLQHQDNLAGTRMEELDRKQERIRVAQVKFATDLVRDTRKALSEEVDQKVVAVRTEFTQQINEVRQYLQQTLKK